MEPENPQLLYQSILEFWKTTFEYFKAYSTIRLASIAAFAGLLAGAFQNPPPATDSMLSLIPYMSSQLLGWFDNHRSIFMTALFFTLTFAGYFTLVGTHSCRKALWRLRNKSNSFLLTNLRRYKRLKWIRPCVQKPYLIATIDFFITAALSIKLH